MKTFTRDDTEHGKEYVLRSDAQAKIELLTARVHTLEAAVRDAATWLTLPRPGSPTQPLRGRAASRGAGIGSGHCLLTETAPTRSASSHAIATRPALMVAMDADDLAQAIRIVDGKHSLGAGALAEKLVEHFQVSANAAQQRWNDAFVGAFDTPVAHRAISEDGEALAELAHRRWLALENVRVLASRHRSEEWAGHMLRFCESAGNTAQILRTEAAPQESPPQLEKKNDDTSHQQRGHPALARRHDRSDLVLPP